MSSVANYLVLSEMQLMTQLIAKREIRQQSLCLDSTFNNRGITPSQTFRIIRNYDSDSDLPRI